MEKIQVLVTVTHSLDGKEGAHVARGSLEPRQLLAVAEKIRIEAAAMCTAYQLSEAHELRFIMEMVKMLYILLKAAFNTGQPFVTSGTARRSCFRTVAMCAVPVPAACVTAMRAPNDGSAACGSFSRPLSHVSMATKGWPVLNAALSRI